jgi:hypothetical protein
MTAVKIKYRVLYASGKVSVIEATNLLTAQLAAHAEAKELKTIVISVKQIQYVN